MSPLGRIESAFEGQDAVYYLVALSPLFKPDGGDRCTNVSISAGPKTRTGRRRARRPPIRPAERTRCRPEWRHAYIRSKGQAEGVGTASALDWAIFRPSVVFGDGGEFVSFTKRLKGMFAPGVPLYPLPGNGETRFQPIWVGDLVPMLADAVEGDDHAGETYRIGGPEKLTLRDITNGVRRRGDVGNHRSPSDAAREGRPLCLGKRWLPDGR